MRPMSIDDIGFGVTNRKFTAGAQVFTRGMEIPLHVLKTMPSANRNALIENRVISVHPKSVTLRSVGKNGKTTTASQEAAEPLPLHVVALGFGKYDVIRGTIEAKGLSREDADAFVEKAGAKAAPVNQPPSEPSPASGNDALAGSAAPKAARAAGKGSRKGKRGSKRRSARRPKPGDAQQNGPIEN